MTARLANLPLVLAAFFGAVALAGPARAADEHGKGEAAAHGEAGHGEASHGEAAEGAKPAADEAGAAPAVPLWSEVPAVEADKQPYMLVRRLRAIQDQIAAGSTSAHDLQRQRIREIGALMRELPVAVWDDVRNVRAAIFLVLSGGDPAVLKAVIGRQKSPHVERRLLKGALAYGEGRMVDALGMLHKLEARKLDASLGGMVALIQGTLTAKKDPLKAAAYFDEARLLAPGTLIEESALRQEILILAREGQLERFDLLAAQYSRRFPNSLFARNFRRQFFAGVARQSFKRGSEWLSRTETELMKAPAAERAGLYLAIADEATKAGNIDIARFTAGKARALAQAGSRTMQRAMLFEGAALAATADFEAGLDLLRAVDAEKLTQSERQIREAALAVAGAIGRWPAKAAADEAELPASVGRAQALVATVDTLLGGLPQ